MRDPEQPKDGVAAEDKPKVEGAEGNEDEEEVKEDESKKIILPSYHYVHIKVIYYLFTITHPPFFYNS
jgi:hypothetical protein